MLKASYKHEIIRKEVKMANQMKKPLYLLILATKPCYIKLASMAKALSESSLPHLIVDTGQHYDSRLTSAMDDFGYRHNVSVSLDVRGDLVSRCSDLAFKLKELHKLLIYEGLEVDAIPLVSGDTSTAGVTPILWYFQTGIQSIHIEAGLRSRGPDWNWLEVQPEAIVCQRDINWNRNVSMPYPEGVCTRIATQVSQLLFAPIFRNKKELLYEGNEDEKIILSGSLSADAIEMISKKDDNDLERNFPELKGKSWIRVDIHRRENMTYSKLEAIFNSMIKLAESGESILFIVTNAVISAIDKNGFNSIFKKLESSGVVVQPVWDSYCDVLSFLRSSMCRLIYTDSGGLQEEAQILGIPCLTCRYETDRPETILEASNNLLLPPINGDYIAKAIKHILYDSLTEDIWPSLGKNKGFYGKRVADKIVASLKIRA